LTPDKEEDVFVNLSLLQFLTAFFCLSQDGNNQGKLTEGKRSVQLTSSIV